MPRVTSIKNENGLQAADSTCNPLFLLEAASGFEPENNGFADRRLTTWLCRHWSGKRDLNPRLQPWQGCTLPLSYSRIYYSINVKNYKICPSMSIVKNQKWADGRLEDIGMRGWGDTEIRLHGDGETGGHKDGVQRRKEGRE